MQAVPALILVSGLPWVPESPRFLIKIGEDEQARRVLSKLHESHEAEIEFAQIKNQLRIDEALPKSWSSLVTKKSYRKRALFALILAFGTQATGILVINSMWLLSHSFVIPSLINVTSARLLFNHLYESRLLRLHGSHIPSGLQYARLRLWRYRHLHR